MSKILFKWFGSPSWMLYVGSLPGDGRVIRKRPRRDGLAVKHHAAVVKETIEDFDISGSADDEGVSGNKADKPIALEHRPGQPFAIVTYVGSVGVQTEQFDGAPANHQGCRCPPR